MIKKINDSAISTIISAEKQRMRINNCIFIALLIWTLFYTGITYYNSINYKEPIRDFIYHASSK